MVDLAALSLVVLRGSKLAWSIYQFAATTAGAAGDLHAVAGSVSDLCLTLQHLAAAVKEDDTLPSAEAIETLEDILQQCNITLTDMELVVFGKEACVSSGNKPTAISNDRVAQSGTVTTARLGYDVAYMHCLRLALSVLIKTLGTAQAIVWSRTHPTLSSRQASTAVANERDQLETLIVEQQMSIFTVRNRSQDLRLEPPLLMENDASRSVISLGEQDTVPKLASLLRYQEPLLAHLDTSHSKEQWLAAVCRHSRTHLEQLLQKWTRLYEVEREIFAEERRREAENRRAQQPSVESVPSSPRFRQAGLQTSSANPFSLLPIPVGDSAITPTASTMCISPTDPVPPSARPDAPNRPSGAFAAIEKKQSDEQMSLEIPWRLRTRHCYWEFIDDKVKKTNTNQLPVSAFSDKNSWTEIMVSWVCRQAVSEANLTCTQVQMERRYNGRTMFEPCLYIHHPLTFDQVQRLIDRTIEIYRESQPPTALPPLRRSTTLYAVPRNTQPLDRSFSLPNNLPSAYPSSSNTRQLTSDRCASSAQRAREATYSPHETCSRSKPTSPAGDEEQKRHADTRPRSSHRRTRSSSDPVDPYRSRPSDSEKAAKHTQRRSSDQRPRPIGDKEWKAIKAAGLLASIGGLALMLDCIDFGRS